MGQACTAAAKASEASEEALGRWSVPGEAERAESRGWHFLPSRPAGAGHSAGSGVRVQGCAR